MFTLKNRFKKLTIFLLILFFGIALGIYLTQNKSTRSFIKKAVIEFNSNFNNSPNGEWPSDFKIVKIKSSKDSSLQKSYFYKSKSNKPKPLIVSLHEWDGYYAQNDSLAELCKQKDLNYIHPDFRGPNRTKDACCSDLALNDIDDAIDYAIANSNVDTNKIFVIGASGGGYASLCTFMKSKHKISKFSAWASISDLNAWYHESVIRDNLFAESILDCTSSKNELNIENAKQKSPIFWDTPKDKLTNSKLSIYAGVYDGIQGSVPITHSINFYNKLLTDLSVSDSSSYISVSEKLKLLEFRKPLGDFGSIANRKICLKKEFKNVSITIFEGNHEILSEFALNELLEE